MILTFRGKDYEPMVTREGNRMARNMLKYAVGDVENDPFAQLDYLMCSGMYRYRMNQKDVFEMIAFVLDGPDGGEPQVKFVDLLTELSEQYYELLGFGGESEATE